MRDMTEKLQIEQECMRIQELFLQFADNIDDVFWVRDLNNMLYANLAYEKVWGKSRRELYDNPLSFMDAVILEDRPRLQAAFEAELDDSTHVFNEIYRIKNRADEIRWIHAKTFPIHDSLGNYVRSAGIAKDITAEKRLTTDLHHINAQLTQMVKLETHKRIEKEMAFGSIFEMMGSAVCIVNSEGLIADANAKFLSLFECGSKDMATGKSFCRLLDIYDQDKELCVFKDIIDDTMQMSLYSRLPDANKTQDVSSSPREWSIATKNGGKLTVLADVACFYNCKNEFNFVVSLIDITTMRELEERQKESERLLMSQSKLAAMGEMIGAIAHQWRQPLNLLGLIVQDVPYSYKNGELTEEYAKKFAKEAMTQINLMSRTIDDFRNFFRNDKNKKSFYLGTQTKNSLELVVAMFKSYGIEVTVLEESNPSVTGYPNELTQAILNIVTNAKDALESLGKVEESKITITIRQDDTWGEIIIKDNAGGIPANIISRVFEPYYTTKGPDRGTGIGLYMSKTIVETNMGGSLDVYNDDDGAVFTIKLPLDGNQ
jgi:PAS domain S-box-containing protein